MKKVSLIAEVAERKDSPGSWGVEAIDDGTGDGSVMMAIFSGPGARDRAEEYANAKFAERVSHPSNQEVTHE